MDQTIDPSSEIGTVRTASGLIVPADAVRQVRREVWGSGQVKRVRAAIGVLKKKQLGAVLLCSEPCCAANPIIQQTIVEDGRNTHTLLTCGHLTRHIPGVL